MGADKPFISFVDITLRLGDRLVFCDTSWQIGHDEQWAILGPNGSGKSTLVRSLWGGTPLRSGRITFDFGDGQTHDASQKDAIGYVSFELHQLLMEYEELQEDLRAYAGKKEGIMNVRDVILSGISPARRVEAAYGERLYEIADQLDIRTLLERGIAHLSTGEMHKTLIARALMKSPKLLILDEPFEGLDESTRELMAKSIDGFMKGPMRVILVTHRLEEIMPNITHVLLVKDGQIFRKGGKDEILTSENISQLYGCELRVKKGSERYRLADGRGDIKRISADALCSYSPRDVPDVLIDMKDVTVRYGDVLVLDGVNWVMKRRENWALLGPNGSGKSTIVRLILGDDLQGYANRVVLFGKQKGSGETVWQTKKRIGFVSPELQIQYRKKMSAYDAIASGFHDSMGLYRYLTAQQKTAVDQWIGLLGIEDIVRKSYHQLSYGERRMLLIARAMVKSPVLLIMDEPCYGLDIRNRRRILGIMEAIGKTQTDLLYVTHRKEEILRCITHVMFLWKGKVLNKGRKGEMILRV